LQNNNKYTGTKNGGGGFDRKSAVVWQVRKANKIMESQSTAARGRSWNKCSFSLSPLFISGRAV
jgi:hypothetical protein